MLIVFLALLVLVVHWSCYASGQYIPWLLILTSICSTLGYHNLFYFLLASVFSSRCLHLLQKLHILNDSSCFFFLTRSSCCVGLALLQSLIQCKQLTKNHISASCLVQFLAFKFHRIQLNAELCVFGLNKNIQF